MILKSVENIRKAVGPLKNKTILEEQCLWNKKTQYIFINVIFNKKILWDIYVVCDWIISHTI